MSNNAPDYENNLAFDPDINTMPRCDIEALKSEIKHLKELLKECRERLGDYAEFCIKGGYLNAEDEAVKMITKIDNAIGENN